MTITRSTEPITASDGEIEASLLEAHLPALLPALALATGDLSLLREELRPASTAPRFLMPMRVVGRNEVELHEQWDGDARAYMGITVPNFPNLFLMYGPNTNIAVNGSIIFFAECEMQYILECVRLLIEEGHQAMDCTPEAHDAYNEWIDEANLKMVWGVATVNSWYHNETGRAAQNWPFSLLEYWEQTRKPDPAAYEFLQQVAA